MNGTLAWLRVTLIDSRPHTAHVRLDLVTPSGDTLHSLGTFRLASRDAVLVQSQHDPDKLPVAGYQSAY